MKYFLIAGEASGDLHASHLMQALSDEDKNARFVGLGGDKMRAAGCDIRVDYRDMAYMGVIAVLLNLHKIQRNFRIARQTLLTEQPDVLILIDYPSFNLKMAQFCRRHLPHTRIIYYIPPKVWAWKAWRVHRIARYTDEVLGIFPFEPAFYARYGYQCRYIGNPTADCIRDWKQSHPQSHTTSSTAANPNIAHPTDTLGSSLPTDKPLIAILPGSRPSEIKHCLPTMLEAARRVAAHDYHIIVAAAPGIEDTFYAPYLLTETLTRDTYALVASARAAVVNSGTATLETALLGCPQTAVYYIACSRWLEWLIRPIVFRIPFFTLVNIIPQSPVIQELIASRFTADNIEQELRRLLTDLPYRKRMTDYYALISRLLGNAPAAIQAARIITHPKTNSSKTRENPEPTSTLRCKIVHHTK